eukprot:6127092-Ditylum_brightwellii.AAC.1
MPSSYTLERVSFDYRDHATARRNAYPPIEQSLWAYLLSTTCYTPLYPSGIHQQSYRRHFAATTSQQFAPATETNPVVSLRTWSLIMIYFQKLGHIALVAST